LDKKVGELRFQEGLERLEGIVKALEGEALELEEALDRYEEGLTLYRRLCSILNHAEERIEALSGEKAGRLQWEKFPGRADGGTGEPGQGPDQSRDER
jgi:exodeoxyribonuclease VII small subunit